MSLTRHFTRTSMLQILNPRLAIFPRGICNWPCLLFLELNGVGGGRVLSSVEFFPALFFLLGGDGGDVFVCADREGNTVARDHHVLGTFLHKARAGPFNQARHPLPRSDGGAAEVV